MGLASLLDFGSGYDPLLKATENKPAASSNTSVHEAAEFAVLGMAMQDALPDASEMVEYPRYQVSGAYNIDPTEEKEVMPGVTMTSPGPLTPLLASIQDVLNETGRSLIDNGHSSLGAFILSVIEEQEVTGQPPSAAFLVEQIVENLKVGFMDCYEVEAAGEKSVDAEDKKVEQCDKKGKRGSEMVVFHRKAQQLVSKLYLRFAKSDPRFDFKDIDELSLDSGEIMVAVLVKKGLLQLSPELEAKIEVSEDLKNGIEVMAMRAAAVEAGRRVCEEARKEAEAVAGGGEGKAVTTIAPRHLSAYLLRQAETEEDLKKLQMHINTATVAY